jgi:hypothetical protein
LHKITISCYFCVSNLRKDKFLRQEILKNDGWVELGTLAGFERMKSLCQDVKEIACAVRSSSWLEVDAFGLQLRRKVPLPPDYDPISQTVYVTGLHPRATLEDISACFASLPEVRT